MSNSEEYNWNYKPSAAQRRVLNAMKNGKTLKCSEGANYRVWLQGKDVFDTTPVDKRVATVLSIQECIGPDDSTKNSMKLLKRGVSI